MSIIQIETNLDVIKKQRALVKEALGKEGIYIRAKETLIDLLDRGSLTDEARSAVIAETISKMVGDITASSMSVGLQWASQEKELALKKEELELQLDILAAQKDKLDEDIKTSLATTQLQQAKLLREYGAPTKDADGNVVALMDEGAVWENMQLVKKQVEQAAAAISKIKDDKLTSAEQRLNIEAQTSLYARQERGFDDNKYQKLFEAQINAWGTMFSSGMLTEKPAIITGDKVSQLYNELTSGLNP